MNGDFVDFLEMHVSEYTAHIKKYGSIGIKRVKNMILGEEIRLTPEPPQRLVLNESKRFGCSMSTEDDKVDVMQLVENFNNKILTINNMLRYDYPDFIAINRIELNYGIQVYFSFYEPIKDFNEKLKDYNKCKELNDLIPVIQHAHTVYSDNVQKHVRNMRRMRIQRQLKDLQEELDVLGKDNE